MAVKRVRFCRVTADGETTTFHLETSSDIVLRPDGSSVEQTLQKLAAGGVGGGGGGDVTSAQFDELAKKVDTLTLAAVNHVSANDLKALETKLTAALADKADRTAPVAFSIASNAWVSDGTDGYPFYYNIAAAGVTAAMTATVMLSPACIDIATEAGICPTVETIANAVRLRCKKAPTGPITGEYTLVK